MIIVSDDFPGLDQAIANLYPKTDHQLCFVHLQRNVRRNMSKTDSTNFNKKLSSIKLLNDYHKSVKQFEELCNEYADKYKSFINYLLSRKELYFNFVKYPEEIRKHIYTTNVVENFNRQLESMRVENGGYFQSVKTLEVSIYIKYQNLLKREWSKPLIAFRSCEYEINQIFNSKFFPQTQFEL